MGTFNVMEAAKKQKVRHLLMASTSSVYGANDKMPFIETERADTQLTIYLQPRRPTSRWPTLTHISGPTDHDFPVLHGLRARGRPDLALYKFVDAILEDQPIDIYNNGDMYRDFTYVGDLVRGISMLIDAVPRTPDRPEDIPAFDSLSPVAPYRVVNIGNSDRVRLLDFIDAIEECLGKQATRNYMPMQKGDVPATWADTSLLAELTGFSPDTNFKDGIRQFVEWYREYKGK